ncbi:MAG: energy transducer TonB [Bacteroidota bacterium]|nr:energy transducer TonB [Bacteroidota bacterium]
MLYSKKNPCSDLSKDTLVFRLLGFVFALSFAFITFSFTTFKKNSKLPTKLHFVEDGIEEIICGIPPKLPQIPIPEKKPFINEIKIDKTNSTPTELLPETIPIEPESDVFIKNQPKKEEVVIDDPIYEPIKSVIPKFKGGENALKDFIDKNLKYPDEALLTEVEATIHVLFDINQDGSITNVRTKETYPIELINEAIRVIKLTNGMWHPAIQREKAVKVIATVPVTFLID